MQTPAAVIFDCDGVLVDSEILAIEVELAMLAGQGLTYERPDYTRRFLGLSPAAGRAALNLDAMERLGRLLDDDFHHQVQEALHHEARTRLTEVAGCAVAVSALGLPKAVASSSGAAFLREKLRLTGLLAAFDPHIYSADLVARAKPHPDVFLHAAGRLDVDPGACLAIEDSVNGVTSARAAGMTVWGFAGGGHMDGDSAARLAEAGADTVIGSWEEAGRRFAAFG